eukprot:2224744-Prymnesium_polylepis.1
MREHGWEGNVHFEASWADGDGSLVARSASGSSRPYVVRLASASFRGRSRAGIAGRWLEIAVALGAEPPFVCRLATARSSLAARAA